MTIKLAMTWIWLLLIAMTSPSGVLGAPFLHRRDLNFDYDSDYKVRGINLGGWFLTEPFISPSLYQGVESDPVDEYHLCKALGQESAQSLLENHWKTWIVESDFEQIASWGFNHVRIPVGYWAFDLLPDDPYVQGQEQYLDQAIDWARDNDLNVWIDLHGVPASQNGFDNSGLRGVINWQTGDNVNRTKDTLAKLAAKYGADEYSDVVTGIGLVNEPLGPVLDMDEVKKYYYEGWDIVRDPTSDNDEITRENQYGFGAAVVISDAFQPLGYWDEDLQPPDYWHVILDHHQYQVFSSGELERSIDEHIAHACNIGKNYTTETLWGVTGEWSAALTDCTPWLNGVGRGSRYEGLYENSPKLGTCEGINDLSSWSQDKLDDTRRYVEAQMDAFERQNGWIFWTYKTEGSVEWDVRILIENNLFPQPLDDRWYPNQCGY